MAIQTLFVTETSGVPELLNEVNVTLLESFNEAVSFVCIELKTCPLETAVNFVELLYLKLSIGAGKLAMFPVGYPFELK
jgi:hypothetical protein